MNSSLTKIYWDTKLPIYKVSHSKLSKMGITCLLIDVDGTLLSRNSIIIPKRVKDWIIKAKEIFDLYLISNNLSEKRIYKIGKELGIKYKYGAQKPRIKKTLEVINNLNNGKNIEYCNHGVEVTAIETTKSKFSNKSNCSLINKSQYPNLYSNILQHKLPYPRNCSYRPGLCKFKSTYFIETKILNKYLITKGIGNSNVKIAEIKDKKKNKNKGNRIL